MSHAEKYFVRIHGGASPLSLVWDSARPLPVGYPARLVLERSPSTGTLRAREIRGAEGTAYAGGLFEIPVKGLETSELTRGGLRLEVRRYAPQVAIEGTARAGVVHAELPDGEFRKFLKYSQGALAVFLIALLAIPNGMKSDKKVDETLVPPQFAKLLLQPKAKQEEKRGRAAPMGGAANEDTQAGTQVSKAPAAKAADTAIVKAFRAKALQSAVQGLLKGGMTSLLAAESQLLAGDSRASAKRIFDRAQEGAVPMSPDASSGNGRGVAVASLGGGGGGGVGGGVGTGVGYGAGKSASIAGQGESFVGLDLPSSVEDGLTKDEVGKVIHSHISEIRYCYEAAMIRTPDIEGKLVLDFTIGGNGAVKTAAVKESSLNEARLDDCILRRLTKWSFPKPNGGVDVAVSYPFLFKALKR